MASTESWADAHVTIGSWFMAAGAIALLCGLLTLFAPIDSIGPVVVVGSIAMLVPVVIGVVVGTNRLQPR